MSSAERAELVGGPFDGLDTALRTLPFVWVWRTGSGVRVFLKPGRERLLYRREGEGNAFVYAGHTHALCSECEVPQPRSEEGTCSGCGAKLIPA